MSKGFWSRVDNDRLRALLSKTRDAANLKHIQAVYLKSAHGMMAEEIAKIVGFSKGYLWSIHSLYRNKGEEAFELGRRGGDFHRNISYESEKALLSEMESDGDLGKILEVRNIKKRYEELANKQVHKSVIYRMLARHGWRKVAPRPYHPKNDKDATDAFKKTFQTWYKMV